MKKEDMIKEFEMALKELKRTSRNSKYYKTNFSYANGRAEALATILDSPRYNAMGMYASAKAEALRNLGFYSIREMIEN